MDDRIRNYFKGTGYSDEEIENELNKWKEQSKRAEEYKKKYYEDKACCPKCGAEGHSTTLMGVIYNHGNPEPYVDRNNCVCSQCGDKHICHDRVPKKQEENG